MTFHIMTPDGEETGCAVTKKRGHSVEDWLREMFTTSDNFLVQFPEFMKTTQRKLLLICAVCAHTYTRAFAHVYICMSMGMNRR